MRESGPTDLSYIGLSKAGRVSKETQGFNQDPLRQVARRRDRKEYVLTPRKGPRAIAWKRMVYQWKWCKDSGLLLATQAHHQYDGRAMAEP